MQERYGVEAMQRALTIVLVLGDSILVNKSSRVSATNQQEQTLDANGGQHTRWSTARRYPHQSQRKWRRRPTSSGCSRQRNQLNGRGGGRQSPAALNSEL